MILLEVLALFILACGLAGGVWWVERRFGPPGFGSFFASLATLVGAVVGIVDGQKLLPAILAGQAVFFFMLGRYARSVGPSVGSDRPSK